MTDIDFPWVHGVVEALPTFEEYRPLFAEQERAIDTEDDEQAAVLYQQIRTSLSTTFPNGTPVPEFLLRIHHD